GSWFCCGCGKSGIRLQLPEVNGELHATVAVLHPPAERRGEHTWHVRDRANSIPMLGDFIAGPAAILFERGKPEFKQMERSMHRADVCDEIGLPQAIIEIDQPRNQPARRRNFRLNNTAGPEPFERLLDGDRRRIEMFEHRPETDEIEP